MSCIARGVLRLAVRCIAASVLTACSKPGGLLIFEISRAPDVAQPELIEITADDHTERFSGDLERKPGLFLDEGHYEVRVAGIADGRVTARAVVEGGVQVVSGLTRVVRVHLTRVKSPDSDAGVMDAGGLDGGLDAGMDADASDAQAGEGDRDAAGMSPEVPRNPACGAASLPAPVQLFRDDFESYPEGMPIESGASSPWISAEDGREDAVTTAWAYSGRALLVTSFAYDIEWLYVRLPAGPHPAKVIIETFYTLDGYFQFRDFAELGLALLGASKFDLTPIVAVRGQDHALLLKDRPADPEAGVTQQGIRVFEELGYSRNPLGEPPVHQYVRIELDLCADQAHVFVGDNARAPLRASVPIMPLPAFNAFYVAGGLNPTYFDNVTVTAQGEGL